MPVLRRVVAACAVLVTAVAALDHGGPAAASSSVNATRLFGSTRWGTAASAALAATSGLSDRLVLASGEDFPDGLAAADLVGALGAPMLLTARDALPAETLDALAILAEPAARIDVIGGPNAVSPAVRSALTDRGYTVAVYEGANRYDTARLLASEVHLSGGGRLGVPVGTVAGLRAAFVVSGEAYPDALVAGAGAAQAHLPVLLTRRDDLPAETSTALDVTYVNGRIQLVIVVGGAAAVGSAVEDVIEAKGLPVLRLAGTDRYDTARAVAAMFALPVPGGGLGMAPSTAVLTTGENFPDALAASQYAASVASPILLTRQGSLPAPSAAALTALRRTVSTVTALGGTAAVSAAALDAAAAAATNPKATVTITSREGWTWADLAFSEPVDTVNVGSVFATGQNAPATVGLTKGPDGRTWRALFNAALPSPGTVNVAAVVARSGNLVADRSSAVPTDTTAPTGTIVAAATNGSGPATRLVVVFGEPVDPATVAPADIVLGGTATCTFGDGSVVAEPHSDGAVYQATCDDGTDLDGVASVAIGTGLVADRAGNATAAPISLAPPAQDASAPGVLAAVAVTFPATDAQALSGGLTLTAVPTGPMAGTAGNSWLLQVTVGPSGPALPTVAVSTQFRVIAVEARGSTSAALAALVLNLDPEASAMVRTTGAGPLTAVASKAFTGGTADVVVDVLFDAPVGQVGPGSIAQVGAFALDLDGDAVADVTAPTVLSSALGDSARLRFTITGTVPAPSTGSKLHIDLGPGDDALADVAGNPATPQALVATVTAVPA